MLAKKKVLKSIQDLPENFSIDELFDRVIFMDKVENGLRQSEKGQTKSTSEATAKLKKWLK
jgi:hypothetical protein